MNKTITIRDGEERIYLFKGASADFADPKLEGVKILGEGKFVLAPFDINDETASRRFDAGRSPGEVKLAPPPNILLAANARAYPAMKVRRIPMHTILLDNEGRDFVQADVDDKAASIKSIRQRTPITVRQAEDGSIHLVAGRIRLEAQRVLGEKWIEAAFFEGDATEARIWQIRENLDHLPLSALQWAEQTTELIRLEAARISRQNVVKKRGRPASGKAQAARFLPIRGKTVRARAKAAERASKIAAIPDEVKAKIKAEKLDNRLSALLDIAQEATPAAQDAKISQIVQRIAKQQAKRDLAKNKTAKSEKPEPKPPIPPDKVLLAELRSECSSDFRRTWAKASTKVKREFLLEVLSWDGGKPVAKDD
jgi:ParB-like chromosome segregation protein Spo0J